MFPTKPRYAALSARYVDELRELYAQTSSRTRVFERCEVERCIEKLHELIEARTANANEVDSLVLILDEMVDWLMDQPRG